MSAPRARPQQPQAQSSSATRHVHDRAIQASRDDSAIGAALGRLTWRRIAHLSASASSQRLLLMKFKNMRLSGWARSLNARGCPHCASVGADGGHTFHMMWRSGAAQAIWKILRHFWQRLGLWQRDTPASTSSFLLAVFSVRLPATPIGATHSVAHPGRVANPDELHDLMQQVWARHVLGCFQTIWNWRQGAADEENPWTYAAASSALRSRLLSSLHSTSASIDPSRPDARSMPHLLTTCRRFIPATKTPQPTPPHIAEEYVLFFDGGSRSNPGPGGAGSAIVRTDRHRTAPPHYVERGQEPRVHSHD